MTELPPEMAPTIRVTAMPTARPAGLKHDRTPA
jgi:hypothetical protein